MEFVFQGRPSESPLVHDPMVDAALQGHPLNLSPRMMQYRFLQATGLTHRTIAQIERARRALKQYMGQTPAQVVSAAS